MPKPALEFDLAVIGSGPGGFRAAIQAAKLGKSVLMVEKGKAGGTSVHTGTIPSKSLREAALSPGSNFKQAHKRMQSVIAKESRVVAEQLKRNSITLVKGTARFENPHEISVSGATYRARNFVIAVGTSPLRHEEFNFKNPLIHDSDSILRLDKLPAKLLIVGAGVIGCEYASIFARLGSEVTLVDRRNELLRSVDLEVIEALKREFKSAGVKLLLGAKIGPFPVKGSAKLKVKLNGRENTFSHALICMGRGSNAPSLSLDTIGVKMNERGFIAVDPVTFQTNLPHICAVGDVIGPPALAAASAEQGRIAACRLFGAPCLDFPLTFPYGIYTIPEISSVGLLEEDAKAKNIPYVTGRAPFAEVARGLIVDDQNGFVKLVVHPETRQILGVHAVGHGASELVHIGQVAMALGASVDFLVDNVFNYPTFAEAYKVAALHVSNQLKQMRNSR